MVHPVYVVSMTDVKAVAVRQQNYSSVTVKEYRTCLAGLSRFRMTVELQCESGYLFKCLAAHIRRTPPATTPRATPTVTTAIIPAHSVS